MVAYFFMRGSSSCVSYNGAMQPAPPNPLYTVTSYADPATAAFVVIPVLLLAILMWGTAIAWKRSEHSSAAAAAAGARARSNANAGAGAGAGVAVAVGVGVAVAAWMALTWMAADSGALRDWSAVPPRFGMLVLGIVTISCAIAFSPLGRVLTRHLPLWTLIAVQSFRLPLELAMHTMSERGVMPEQMTYTGSNFDILTGLTAIAVAAALRSGIGGRPLVWLWNIGGFALLTNVVIIAILSTPTFAWFGEDRLNVWVTYPPYVWLPAVMVTAALTGHLLIFRALRM
jgi:hypothetical protein